MSRARNLADLLNASGKIKSSKMDSASNANRSIDSQHLAEGSVDLAHLSSQSVDEDNLYISNAGTDGQYLQKQSGNAGGLTWGTVDTSTLLPLAGGEMTGNTRHGDNVYSHWGDSNDLQIHHSGTNSYIGDYGTGNLYIRGNNLAITAANGENYVYCVANGSVYLHYDNSLKLKTLSDGIQVYGNIWLTGTLMGRTVLTDGAKLDGIEANATADQTDAEIKTAVEAATNIALGGSPTTTTQSAADNSTKVATTAYADAAVAALADSAPSTLNTLNELAAALGDDANYATTTTAAIGLKAPIASPTFTGDIGMPNGSIDLAMMNANSVDSDQYVDGSIDLAHMSSQSVDEDNLYISNAGTNGQYLQKQSGNDGGLTWATVDTSLLLPKAGGTMTGNTLHGDNVKDTYGTGADLEIYHDGSNSYIDDGGTGDLYLRGSNAVRITSADGSEKTAVFNVDGAVNLFYNNVKKIETTAAGAYVTGDFTASGNVTAYSDERLKSSVETIPDALSKVLSVRGVTFDMNAERGTGVIAQELEKVLPEAVFDNEDGMKSVAYGNVVGLLIEAIKEQQVQIETLMDMVGE
jgi:hypothetical protein